MKGVELPLVFSPRAIASIGNGADEQFGLLKGGSAPMRQLYRVIQRVAPTDATVFLQGESGTGKELIARTLHQLSLRCEQPFLAVNCGALPPTLVESELFGHEKGSFTGASRRHRGYFERAAGGTLFLDEVTEMPAELQVHLLRVLETGTLVRLGGDDEIKIRVRVIAATNRKPEEALTTGRLREDLFFRLTAFPIRVPALRERAGDIRLLAEYFLLQLNQDNGVQKHFSAAAHQALVAYDWPGNVRELKNVIQRAFILADNEIQPYHFPQWSVKVVEQENGYLRFRVGSSIDDVERKLIFATLEHFNGNKRLTAEALSVSLKTLYNRLKRYEGESRTNAE